jgi:hypothetical protein
VVVLQPTPQTPITDLARSRLPDVHHSRLG